MQQEIEKIKFLNENFEKGELEEKLKEKLAKEYDPAHWV